METFSFIYAGNSTATREFLSQSPVTRGFDVFFDLRQNKRLSKQSLGWWFETRSTPFLRHCNGFLFICHWWYEEFGVRSRYLRQGLVITSHNLLWYAITYPCLRFLLMMPKSSYIININLNLCRLHITVYIYIVLPFNFNWTIDSIYNSTSCEDLHIVCFMYHDVFKWLTVACTRYLGARINHSKGIWILPLSISNILHIAMITLHIFWYICFVV